MKTQLHLIILALGLLVSSCYVEEVNPEQTQGPQGPQGPEGPAGESGYLFEFEGVNFTAPAYDVILPYPDDFEGLDSDVALVYLLWGVETDSNGDPIEIWRQLPQTIFHPMGLLLYNYDFTLSDVRLFLDGEFNLDGLGAIDTDDWVVRIVVVPGEFWASGRSSIDHSDYQAVVEAYGLPELAQHGNVEDRRK